MSGSGGGWVFKNIFFMVYFKHGNEEEKRQRELIKKKERKR